APGLKESEVDTPAIRALSAKLFPRASTDELSDLKAAVEPDFATGTGFGIGFSHRRLDNADIYFVANTTKNRFSGRPSARVSRARMEIWDPFTGRRKMASVEPRSGRVAFALELQPYESRIFVVTDDPASLPRETSGTPATAIRLDSDWTVTFPGERPLAMPQ